MSALKPTTILMALISPLARYCLKRGVRIRELEELIRQSLVKEAHKVIDDAHGAMSVSKISVVTGIHRLEVARLIAGEQRPQQSLDVLTRVVGLWSQKKTYRTRSGSPRPLSYQGVSSEFANLVASVSKEVSHYPILFELERIGAIVYEDDLAKLVVAEYTPQGNVDHGLNLLSSNVHELTDTVESNLTDIDSNLDLHLTTSFDNISPDHLSKIKQWILERGAAFQREMREYLSSFDRDINPTNSPGKERAKVSVTTFSNARILKEVKELKPKKRGRKPCAPKK